MASDMASMFKALLEAQEREMTWNPTSHHGFESSSTYQDELLNENFPPVDQYGYGASCQSLNMAHHYGATYPSPTPNEEEIYNMFKLILEGQEASNKMLRDQTWIMKPDHAEAHPSPTANAEEIYNMMQLLLEGQEELNKSFREESEKLTKSMGMLSAKVRDSNHDLKVAAPTHEENAEIKDEFLPQLNMDDNISNRGEQDDGMADEDERAIEEFCRLLDDTSVENLVVESDVRVQNNTQQVDENDTPRASEDSDIQDGEDFSTSQAKAEKFTQEDKLDQIARAADRVTPPSARKPVVSKEKEVASKDDFLQEAEKTVAEFELLLGCTIDENLVIRYEDPCDDGLVAESLDNERMHKQLICQQETEGAKLKEKSEIHIEEATNEVRPELSPEAQPFDKYLGTLLPHAVSFYDPWKIPFEEIRMKEFKGWFYDEYDPGDRNPCYTPL